MSKVAVHLIKSPSDEEINDMVNVHVQAYEGDPFMRVMIGGNWALLPDLGRAMLRATLLEGMVYGVKDENDKVVAFGLWFSPETGLFASPEQRALGFDEFFGKLDHETQHWFSNTYPEATRKYGEALFTDEERLRRWWCFNIVTSPDHQNHGYATAIIDHSYCKAVNAGGFIGLATSQTVNVQKYLSMGLHERGKYTVPSPAGSLEVHILIH
ncbi:hypothetical protein K435DRAFT_756080 [Dendrothele bispora CBS 962.96]|uniref:N-acetyltransferase domain-containing protein n=1 Tax=Dendrothele bispora (strain CBS 962.96) TaxID=1314807 RepID=A0A4S8LZQ6_DENBC|nr:hypothetical protein K435DRAFT_756080 [Dendrothele bispora CBS 962.96]